jgi:hypothetical protein
MRAKDDIGPGLVVVAVGVFLALAARRIHDTNFLANDPLGPDTLPEATGVLLAALGAGIALRALVRMGREATVVGGGSAAVTARTEDELEEHASIRDPGVRSVAVAVSACLLFTLLFQNLGFLLTGFLFMVVMIGFVARATRPVLTVVMSVVVTVGCYLLFVHFVGEALPLLP